MPAEREMIDRPKYESGTALDQTLRREDEPCPEGTRIWLGLSQEEQYYTRWSPETRHWWLELPDEHRDRAFRAKNREGVARPEAPQEPSAETSGPDADPAATPSAETDDGTPRA